MSNIDASTKSHAKDNNITYSTNREYKDRLFRFIFGREERKTYLLSLYNALNHTAYDNINDLSITTIDDVIYIKMKNDVSCIISSHMNLYEHQSTVNPNMPFRQFEYCAKLYNKYVTEQQFDLYGKKLFKIPAPKCFVLYNGLDIYPEYMELKLSDAFEFPSKGYEWTSYVYNINDGYNQELKEQCTILKSYSDFIELTRQKIQLPDLTTEEAIDEAVREYIAKGDEFSKLIQSNRAEVIDMCLTEYNQELHEENLRAEGKTEGLLSAILNLIQNEGWSFEKAVCVLHIPEVDIAYYREKLEHIELTETPNKSF